MSVGRFIELKPQLLEKIESALNEPSYRDAIENSSKYNNQLVKERKTRLPFIDPQTGVAQNNCFLWMHRWERMPGMNQGQIYSYPSRRWHRKRRSYLIGPSESNKCNKDGEGLSKDLNSLNAEHLIKNETNESSLDKYDLSKDNWLHDFDDGSDLPDAGELDEDFSSDSSGEYTPRKRKKKKEPVKKRKNQSSHNVHHHSSHSNSSQNQQPSQHSVPSSSASSSLQQPSASRNTPTTMESGEGSTLKASAKDGRAAPNKYCDFCLGDSDENKKTKSAERMVSCSDCGRSAHPTCLQFTPRMVLSVKKYRWQCIECKSCAVCGTSDNDEQLLFCDDCDRGYHMYCLDPPLTDPPEGSWSCKLCIAEYHTSNKK